MGTFTPQDLLNQWRSERLTTEMAIGHILQNLVQLNDSVNKLMNVQYEMRSDIAVVMERDSTKKAKNNEQVGS